MYRQKSTYNQFKNVKQTYDGYSYDSRFEAGIAMELDERLKKGEIANWERQFPVRIEYDGRLICTYYCDFRIEHLDGSFELLEAKGLETPYWKLKVKLLDIIWLPQHLDHVYTVIKQKSYYRP